MECSFSVSKEVVSFFAWNEYDPPLRGEAHLGADPFLVGVTVEVESVLTNERVGMDAKSDQGLAITIPSPNILSIESSLVPLIVVEDDDCGNASNGI